MLSAADKPSPVLAALAPPSPWPGRGDWEGKPKEESDGGYEDNHAQRRANRDGRIATVRRPKGRDSIRAHDAAPGENKFKFTCALLAQIVTLDGKPCVIEDILELYASDIDKLATETGGDFLSSSAPSSPSSSNGDSDSRS